MVETNVVLLDDIAGKAQTGLVARIRQRIWGEHLRHDPGRLTTAPSGGWLPLWQDSARTNVAALAEGKPPASAVLPFVASPRRGGDAKALRQLGIDPDQLDLKP